MFRNPLQLLAYQDVFQAATAKPDLKHLYRLYDHKRMKIVLHSENLKRYHEIA